MIVGENLDIYENMLPEIWASTIYNTVRKKSGELYGLGFLQMKRNYAKQWINNPDKLPGESILRLRKINQCVYCDNDLKFIGGVGDHAVGREMDSALWMLPCCTKCNSSKGKKDLIDWWVSHKGYDITDLKRDVLSIFVRAKFRILLKHNLLCSRPIESYYVALKQIQSKWI